MRRTVDYLLICAPNLLLANRLQIQLSAGGLRCSRHEHGIEVRCTGVVLSHAVESLALSLSPMERRDTRVATLSASDDASAVNRAIFCARSVDELLAELREQWVDELIDDDRIAIHFQPLMQYPPGRVHGYECLMRGIDDGGRLVAPDRIFAAASSPRRLRMLDEKCRAAAITAAGMVRQANLRFFINFIPSIIESPQSTTAAMLRQVDAAGLRPEQIVLEVVESDRCDDPRHLAAVVRRLREAGFKIALDDVGSAYASLLMLLRLRPDYMKLDGELVRRAETSAIAAKIVADLAETARQNGIMTVAEGIETEQQLRLVTGSGIRLTQGYIHCRPQATVLTSEMTMRAVDRMTACAA